MSLPAAAHAADYFAHDDISLGAAIAQANANGDANAVIKLTADVTINFGSPLTTPTVPVTIDTQGFKIFQSAVPTVTYQLTLPNQFTFNGTFVGVDSAGGTPGSGLLFGSTALTGDPALRSAVVNGNVTGGTQTGAGTGGAGVSFSQGAKTLINHGNITGGEGPSGGAGVSLSVNNALVNTGAIQGGSANGGSGGAGISFGTTVTGSIINSGAIRGGSDLLGGAAGGSGIRLTNGTVSIQNTGTIEGGSGGAGIAVTNGTDTIQNSGTIKGGAGAAALTAAAGQVTLINSGLITADTNAIAFTGAALTLELRAGSQIDGIVTAGSTGNDILRFGGSADAVFNAADIGDTQQYRFFDKFVKTGSSTWTLNGNSASTGPWEIQQGTLALNGALTTQMTIDAAGTLIGNGTISGDVTNSGIVMPAGLNTLTINGNYIGNNDTVKINSRLAGDGSASGLLVVTGNTSGTGKIQVTNLGGQGAQTANGIKIVDVQGASNASYSLLGDYVFQGQQAVVGGAYAYRLYQNGIATPADGDWYLRSTLISPSGATTALLAPTVPLYEAYAGVLQNLNALGTFSQRAGSSPADDALARTSGVSSGESAGGHRAWAHIDAGSTRIAPSVSTTAADYKVRTWKLEAGVDIPVAENDAGRLIATPIVHYGTAASTVSSPLGDGAIDVSGYGVGGALTWHGDNGVYIDAQAAMSWYNTDFWSATLARPAANGSDGHGFAAGIETGRRLPLGDNWTVTPQVQLISSRVSFDSFTDQYSAPVSGNHGNSLTARLGVAIDREHKWMAGDGKIRRARVYGITNLYYDFQNDTSTQIADVNVESRPQSLWAGLGAGAFVNLDDERFTVYGEVLARTSVQDFGDSNAIGAKLGLRIRW